MKQTIAVGTTNPVKINAVSQAFRRVYPDIEWEVIGIDVPSGVSNQPMTPQESVKGAVNRAAESLARVPESVYGVGLEGGLEQIGELWFDCGWCAVVNREGLQGIATSARIPTPETMMKHIRAGKELGDVLDLLYNRTNVKQAEGHVGVLTDKLISRTDIYRDAVIIALSRFLHPELFG